MHSLTHNHAGGEGQTEELTGHRKHAHKQSDVSPAHHDILAPVQTILVPRSLVLPCGPDAHNQDEDVEDDNGHQALHVDAHPAYLAVSILIHRKIEGYCVRLSDTVMWEHFEQRELKHVIHGSEHFDAGRMLVSLSGY